MSTDDGSSASQGSTGSADDSAGNQQTNQQMQIKPEDHLRAIDDLKKFKARSRELESQLQSYQQEMEAMKTKGLAESNDFKALYEQASNKNKEWEQKYTKLKENVVFNEKYKAAQKALLDAGIRKEALRILDKEDLEPIIVEHTSEGRMLTSGVEEYVDSFKKNYGFAFEQKGQARVNGGGGNSTIEMSQAMTPSKLYEIEKKHGVRSDQYRAAIEQYKKQKTN
jgi:Skp family chaperone for outer membrane proteins